MCTNCDNTLGLFGYCPYCNNTVGSISNLPINYVSWYDYAYNQILDNMNNNKDRFTFNVSPTVCQYSL